MRAVDHPAWVSPEACRRLRFTRAREILAKTFAGLDLPLGAALVFGLLIIIVLYGWFSAPIVALLVLLRIHLRGHHE